MNGWEPIHTAPEGKMLRTAVIDGKVIKREQALQRHGRLWFIDEAKSSYIYWSPTHWRPDSAEGSR